ncbi:DUF2147 domain-containing protein [Geobacter sp. DSM 9736]|uniref:DUF2147 domain-containing protein n=1 Tax=Geobacter sp. DSM 9736 TaxID=1277350 RepID=UPI000B513076|nr:DUF2147 domain-containing protein [Geobacter sp. DSM 9736]SNB45979.1 hypothetical protein SAMN06269301_1415 [Geobacter sp. DSM 9736]
MVKSLAMVAAICIAAVCAFGEGAESITGRWNSEDGRAKIDIYRCGFHYCGKIVWLGMPEYPPDDEEGMGGRPRVDRENPDPALRNRPLLGLQIMEGFRYAGDGLWEKGRIYDPESGATYKSEIRLVSPRRLELRGYIGIPLFGRSTVWTK